jgi:hypothetical protein
LNYSFILILSTLHHFIPHFLIIHYFHIIPFLILILSISTSSFNTSHPLTTLPFLSHLSFLNPYSSSPDTHSVLLFLSTLFLAYYTITQSNYNTASNHPQLLNFLTHHPLPTLFPHWQHNFFIQLTTSTQHLFIPHYTNSSALTSISSTNYIIPSIYSEIL